MEVKSDRATRSHTAAHRSGGPAQAAAGPATSREYLPNVVTGDDRDPRRPGCAATPACFNGDTTICTQPNGTRVKLYSTTTRPRKIAM